MKIEELTKIYTTVFFRYILLLIIVLSADSLLFYRGLLKLTIYPVNFILNLNYSSFILGNSIILEGKVIELIPACIAIYAFVLLWMLNLSVIMSWKKRILSLIFSSIVFLGINIARIYLLSIMFIRDYVYIDFFHKFLWYFSSIIVVLIIWFLTAHVFKIESIPVYSDFKMVMKEKRNVRTNR